MPGFELLRAAPLTSVDLFTFGRKPDEPVHRSFPARGGRPAGRRPSLRAFAADKGDKAAKKESSAFEALSRPRRRKHGTRLPPG